MNMCYAERVLESPPDLLLPYEAELGTNPTLGRIRELVVSNKYRPVIPQRLMTNEVGYYCQVNSGAT